MTRRGQVSFPLKTLAATLDRDPAYTGSVSLVGDEDAVITGIAPLATASSGDLSHLSAPRYRRYLDECRAGALLLTEPDLDAWKGPAIVVTDPYLAYARLSQCFRTSCALKEGVDASAQVAPTRTES